MGRIHRIGQESTCCVFNFCAENTVEGKLARAAAREARADARRTSAAASTTWSARCSSSQRSRLRAAASRRAAQPRTASTRASWRSRASNAAHYREYEQTIGIAQATKHVDIALGARARLALGGAPAHAGVRRAVLRARLREARCTPRASWRTVSGGSSTSRNRCAPSALSASSASAVRSRLIASSPSARRSVSGPSTRTAALLSPGPSALRRGDRGARRAPRGCAAGLSPTMSHHGQPSLRDSFLRLRGQGPGSDWR